MEKMTVKEARAEYKKHDGKITDQSVDGFVVLKDVDKVYDNRVQAVFRFNLSVKQNEFIVLVGPSGCGKSTTLRMIAGLEEITNGKLYIDNVLANYLASKDRDIAMVFQSYALYPNMNVFDNMGFGLEVRGIKKEEIKERVFRAAEILDLGEYLDRKPKELSGGQMQRVALGRAIVRDAKLFLMDEPLSNLDAKLRVQMRSEIVRLHKRLKATTIYVTHDQTEAMTMADRIVIMNQGIVQQTGTPIEVYNNPANVFVATFIGNPPMNVFKADISGGELKDGGGNVALPGALVSDYSDFIESRKAFFEDLQQKADLSQEKGLLARLAELRKKLRKKTTEELLSETEEITGEILRLSEEKGFMSFTPGDAEGVLADARNADRAAVKSDIAMLESLLKSCDLVIAGILKEYDSATAFTAHKKEAAVPAKNKKKGKPEKHAESLEEENARKIGKYISDYNAGEVKSNALVGIRPEDIYLYEKFTGENAQPVEATVELVELLGSDFCMHVNMFGSELIVKRNIGEVVQSGEKVKLCPDISKIKIFDPVSGKCISAEK